jgi:hypothetical protein
LIAWYAVKWPKQEAGKLATSLKQAPAARLP